MLDLARSPLSPVLHLALPLLLTACVGTSVLDTPPWSEGPERPAPRASNGAITLARHPDAVVEWQLPDSSRPDGQPAPEWFTAFGPFEKVKTRKKSDTVVYRTPLPLHSNLLSTRLKGTHSFGSGIPPGFEVRGPDKAFKWTRYPRGDHSYGFDREYLYIGLAPGEEPPAPTDVKLKLARATHDEDALNYATSEQSERAFAFRNITIDTTSYEGVYLPAPGAITWRLTVPERGVLSWRSRVLEPVIHAAEGSDGATIRVEVLEGEQITEVGTASVGLDAWDAHRLDLSPWAGREVSLRIATEPGDTAVYDHVFLEGATVYTPSDHPERVVLVFIDTLRKDNLPIYGYARPTMPRMSRWAGHGAVFDQARSVAPWTLPSARAVLSGAQPELWYEVDNLPERMAEAGWATEAVIANAFLSEPFDMERGWDRYTFEHLAESSRVSQLGLEALERHHDRDLLLMVHYMDPHLPYLEPWTHQRLWAGIRPPDISITRRWLMDLKTRHPRFEAIRDHVMDRYDQNVRLVDDYLIRVLDGAGADATVVLFSDHGEEFWEHDSFEHGHTLYDELLQVPLVIRGPGVPIGRVDAPVSLLDITPTVLELVGLDHDVRHGTSLVPALWGDPGAAEALAARPQAFGRPLYDEDGWAVLADGKKIIDRDGARATYDLSTDPGEQRELGSTDFSALTDEMSDALGPEVVLAWRIEIQPAPSLRALDLQISHPSGFEDAWPAYDPRGTYSKSKVIIDNDGVLHITQPHGEAMHHEVYAIPLDDPLNVEGLEAKFVGDRIGIGAAARPGEVEVTSQSTPFLVAGAHTPKVSIDFAYVPRPQGVAVSGYSDEMADELKALGYVGD